MTIDPTHDASRRELSRILTVSRLVVAVGSGGVGKTTTAAAVAIHAARLGRRCAVLTIDPAKRLAQALGVERMGNAPTALPRDLTAPGSVDAMMLEAPEALDQLVAKLVPDAERRERLYENRLYQTIARHLGGTHEYMAVDKLFDLVSSGDYDLVVLDTPPTVNALDFLDAPSRLASFFSEKITRFFIRQSEEEKKGFFQRLKDKAGDVAISILGRALGEHFVEELMDFATAFQGLFGAFRERGVVAQKILADPSTSFLVVSGADPVRVSEAAEFTSTLSRLGIAPRAFIANRVHLYAAPDAVVHIEPASLSLPAGVDAAVVARALSAAQALRAGLARRDREGLVQMAKLAGRDRLLVVPELDDEVQDRGAIEHLITALKPA